MSSSRKIDIVQLSFEHGLKLGCKISIAVDSFCGGTFIKCGDLHQARFFALFGQRLKLRSVAKTALIHDHFRLAPLAKRPRGND
jgi:hypothetical protein